jgi:uncharacterized protein YcfJ
MSTKIDAASRGTLILENTSVVCGLAVLVVLAGCAVRPMGPSVAVMPAPNKPFEAFQQDQTICKQFADQQVSGQTEATNKQAVGIGALGTALGAGLGAAIGGGRGAGIGAGSGAVLGGGAGAASSQQAQMTIQQRYDIAYKQCMYARGNQVPGFQPAAAPPPPVERGVTGEVPPGGVPMGLARIGPSSVWSTPCDDLSSACGKEGGLEAAMRRCHASAEAIAFAKTLDFDGYLSEFEQNGKVDTGTITYPCQANDNDASVLLNGDPPVIEPWGEGKKVEFNNDATFADITRRFPNVGLSDIPPSGPSVSSSPYGGQEFVFSFALDTCHACDKVGFVDVALDFDAQGHYVGPRLLRVRRQGKVAPAARGR